MNRTLRKPYSRPSRRTILKTAGAACMCFSLSRWVRGRPVARAFSIWARSSRSISAGRIRPAASFRRIRPAPAGKRPSKPDAHGSGHDQRRDFLRRGKRPAADDVQVHADAQGGILPGQGDRLLESRRVGHQGGTRQDPPAMGQNDSFVDRRAQAEIVGVDDDFLHPGFRPSGYTFAASGARNCGLLERIRLK